MKKIGIVTFHCADNFGAVLQSYSLQHTINKMGYYSEIIDFRPNRITSNYSLFVNMGESIEKYGVLRTIKRVILSTMDYKENKKRIQNFNNFRKKYLIISNNIYITSEELKSEQPTYDYYITGSDQVWNPRFFSEIGESYFLDFAVKESIKISYAASIATKIGDEYLDVFRENLKRFDYISVREKSAKNAIQKLTEKNVHVTIDPTLLTTSEEWSKISTHNIPIDKYILVYDLVKNPLIIKVANKISKELGYKIISYSSKKGYNNWLSSFSSVNPTDFLGLFENAEFVITSSFHGTVYSVIFNKSFYTIPHPTRGSRMIDFLNELDLKERLVQDENTKININEKIDYEKVNNILSRLRKDSIQFLENALKMSNTS